MVARPQGILLVHRPERRGVVCLETGDGPRYAKVVRPQRVGAVVDKSSAVRNLDSREFSVPDLLDVDADAGIIVSSALPGVSLYQLLNSERVVPAAGAAGGALRALHGATPPPNAASHGADDEIAVVKDWCERTRTFMPDLCGSLHAASARVLEALSTDESPPVLLHRDFYDKQVFVDRRGCVGLLDFDTLAMGEAALDVANALVHFELRALQGRCSPQLAATAADALLEGYGPSSHVRRRIGDYADATRVRLACVYAFRPHQVAVVPALLARIGQRVARAVDAD
jgi:aminoglycoside phosphotransferase (APT) family kinase protein